MPPHILELKKDLSSKSKRAYQCRGGKNFRTKLIHGGSVTKLLNIKTKEKALKGTIGHRLPAEIPSTTALARKEWNNSLEMLRKNKFKLRVL